jgi:hypothetical protein
LVAAGTSRWRGEIARRVHDLLFVEDAVPDISRKNLREVSSFVSEKAEGGRKN